MARLATSIAVMLALSLEAFGGFYGGGTTRQWEANAQRYTLTGAGLGYSYRQGRWIYDVSYMNYADQRLLVAAGQEYWYRAQSFQGSVEYRFAFKKYFFAGPQAGVEHLQTRWKTVQNGQAQQSGSKTSTAVPFKECVGAYPDRRSLIRACYEFSSDLSDHANARQGVELSGHFVLADRLTLLGTYYEALSAGGGMDAYRTYGFGVGLSF
ncbi:MAG: hypothetical protein AB7E49_10100 [Campylobacterales bacterium]